MNTQHPDPMHQNELHDDAGPKGNDPKGVRAICRDCEIVARFSSELVANDALDEHLARGHDGNADAGLVQWDLEPIADLGDVLDAPRGLEALVNMGTAFQDSQSDSIGEDDE